MSVKTMRRKVSYSLVLLIFSLALFIFSSYAYFTNLFEESFTGEMGFIEVDLDAYFETVTSSTNQTSGNDVSFTHSTHTISSVIIDLSVYSDGDTIRVDNTSNNDGYYTVSGTPSATNLVVIEDLVDESSSNTILIDEVTVQEILAYEVVIEAFNTSTDTDISFASATNTISSTNVDLSIYSAGDKIRVHGSTDNDRIYTVTGTPTANALQVVQDLTDETAGSSITLDKVITKPGVYYVNIISQGNEFFFEDFRLKVYVYSNVPTYIRVKIYEQLTLTYTDYQGDVTELSILFDGYMPFNFNANNWYDNRTLDNYLYHQSVVQRVSEFEPTEIPLISNYYSGQNFSLYSPGYSLQIGFSIEAVQSVGGPENVWDLTTPPWGGSW